MFINIFRYTRFLNSLYVNKKIDEVYFRNIGKSVFSSKKQLFFTGRFIMMIYIERLMFLNQNGDSDFLFFMLFVDEGEGKWLNRN